MKPEDVHVEHRDTRQRTGIPRLFVILQSRIERIGKLANEGDGPCRTGQMLLFRAVHDLFEDEERDDEGEGGGGEGFAESLVQGIME